jgi:hypothetical protein
MEAPFYKLFQLICAIMAKPQRLLSPIYSIIGSTFTVDSVQMHLYIYVHLLFFSSCVCVFGLLDGINRVQRYRLCWRILN